MSALLLAATTPEAETVARSKALLMQGQRSQAIVELDRAASAAKSKRQAKSLDERKSLFARQFMTSDSFQKYQEARALAEVKRWDECLREIGPIAVGDQDNALILQLKSECHFGLTQYDAASKAAEAVLAMMPADVAARLIRARAALEQGQAGEALALLEKVRPTDSLEIEKTVILKARILERQSKADEAAEVLRADQEANLDHVEILYELGMLYRRLAGRGWQARKALSLFVIRCKRMKDAELKRRGFNELLPRAQAALAEIDKQLGV